MVRGGTRALMVGGVVLVLASGLGGCGRRGGLEPPPDASAPAVKAADAGDPGVSGLRRPKAVPITPPHEPFFLDPLL